MSGLVFLVALLCAWSVALCSWAWALTSAISRWLVPLGFAAGFAASAALWVVL